jgi:hypothetical protein
MYIYMDIYPYTYIGGILELLCEVEGNQIFADGLFNGDCHPGKIMITSINHYTYLTVCYNLNTYIYRL